MSAADYLAGATDGRSNREIALEELLLNWLANENPAYERYDELFDDAPIAQRTAYRQLIDGLRQRLAGEPGFGPDNDDLVSLLRKPALEAPESLAEQIQWLRQRWGFALGNLGDRLAIGLDVIHEDDRAEWLRFNPARAGRRTSDRCGGSACLRRSWAGGGALQLRSRLDAPPRAAGQEHLRLARPAVDASTGAKSAASTRSRTRSSTGSPAAASAACG